MIENISAKLAVSLHRIGGQENMPSIAVLRYGIHIILNFLSTFLATVVIGICTGKLLNMLIVYLVFALLRGISGGMHFKTAAHCFLFSVSAIVLVAHIQLNGNIILVFNVLGLILGAIYAPSRLEGYTRIPKGMHIWLKVLYVCLCLMNFLWMSGMLAFCILIQSLSLISSSKEAGTA